MRVNGVVVVTDAAGDNAEVVAAVANTGRGPGRLTSVLANGYPAAIRPAASSAPIMDSPGRDVALTGNSVTIAGGSAVSFGQPGRPALGIPGGSFVPGHFTQVEFGFAGVGQISVNALVMRNTGLYSGYEVSPAGSPTPSALSSPSPRAGSAASPMASVIGSPAAVAAVKSTIAAPSPAPIRASSSSSAGIAPAGISATPVPAPHPAGPHEPRR